ncbi:helix-turn-helix domain-containing protein [Spirosoma pulveris]
MHNKSTFEALELWFRTLIREEGQKVQHNKYVPTDIPIHDRVGGIKLAEEITGFAQQSIYNLASKRRIPHSKRNGTLVFSEEILRDWLLENQRPLQDESIDFAHPFTATTRRKGVKRDAVLDTRRSL